LRGATFDGSPVEITPGGGNDQLIVFLAHWCPHCNAELPIIEEWRAAGMIPEGLDIVAVSTAVSADRPNYPPSKWLVDKGWTWPALADSADMTAAGAYGVTGYPFMVIVGADGNVKGRTSGQKELATLDAWVTTTLGR
jgi:thiol-disulfide isomerase/thioredoxin